MRPLTGLKTEHEIYVHVWIYYYSFVVKRLRRSGFVCLFVIFY
jgi:hypothetical protein